MAVVDNSLRIFYSPQIVKGRDIDDLCHETGVEFIKLPDYSFKSGIEIVRSLNNIEARSYTNVAFATIPWARAFLRSLASSHIGVIAEEEKLRWSGVSTLLPSEVLLNPDGIVLPWSHLQTSFSKSMIESVYGGEDIFIRPDSPWKPFTGFTTTQDDFDYNINSYSQLEKISANELAVICPAKPVGSTEWRFWMMEGEVITFAPYSWDEDAQLPEECPENVWDLAQSLTSRAVEIDPWLVVDIVESGGTAKVCEMNGFSTSGMYAGADMVKIIRKMQKSLKM